MEEEETRLNRRREAGRAGAVGGEVGRGRGVVVVGAAIVTSAVLKQDGEGTGGGGKRGGDGPGLGPDDVLAE